MEHLHSSVEQSRLPAAAKVFVNVDAGEILISIARAAIANTFGARLPAREDESWLGEPGASFVTLRNQGELRGCVGTLIAERSIVEDVKSNAVSAAFRDSRFAPLTAPQFRTTDIEVSLLSPLTCLQFADEDDLLAQLQPGIDGVVLELNYRRSTFLPQVWEQLPEAHRFMAHLKLKAGLAADFWSNEISISRYTVTKWTEVDFRQGSPTL